MFEPTYRAEGVPAGCLPLSSWPLDPADELPEGRLPMSVLPAPQRPLVQRIAAAICSLGSTVVTGAGLMVLAQYLTTP